MRHLIIFKLQINCCTQPQLEKTNYKKQIILFVYLSLVNPFVPNATFLYPLKTLENRKVS